MKLVFSFTEWEFKHKKTLQFIAALYMHIEYIFAILSVWRPQKSCRHHSPEPDKVRQAGGRQKEFSLERAATPQGWSDERRWAVSIGKQGKNGQWCVRGRAAGE